MTDAISGPQRAWWAVAAVPVLAVGGIFLAVHSDPADVAGPLAGAGTVAGGAAAPSRAAARPASPRLLVVRRVGQRTEALADGQDARRGDVLHLGYVAAGYRYGVLVSVDGRRTATLHLPMHGKPALLAPDGEQRLPEPYELDGAPAFERFFLVACAAPIEAMVVLESARRLALEPGRAQTAPLALPAGCSQTAVRVRKIEPG